MDPTATLDQIRELARLALKREGDGDTAYELAAAIANLDTWMVRGGFPPQQWEVDT